MITTNGIYHVFFCNTDIAVNQVMVATERKARSGVIKRKKDQRTNTDLLKHSIEN
jgi:hypothetical protein